MGSPRFVFVVLVLASALAVAQSGSSNSSKSKTSHTAAAPGFDPGGISDDVYRNLSFAFSYKIPFGWVERTQEMGGDNPDPSRSTVLLAIFERPPDAPGNTVNSVVLIAVERASNYPGLKTAADYFGPLASLTAAKGFKGVSGPDEFAVGAKKLMRGDFVKDMPGATNDKDKLTMQQSSLVELDHGYIVSFTFIAGDEDAVEDLIGNLNFIARK
jgi:hypothetical protein